MENVQMQERAKLKELFEAIGERIETSSKTEIVDACILITIVQELTSAEIDTLYAAFRKGPLDSGDVPSKSGRDSLVGKGLMQHVVVRGRDGYFACTYKGARAYRLIEAGAY
jgi:hypothetical protein